RSRCAAGSVPGGGALGAAAPAAEPIPGVNAGRVAVVPHEAQAPGTRQLGALDPQRLRRPRSRPDLLVPFPQPPALRARAAGAELLEPEPAHVAVVEGDGDAVLTVDVDVGGGRRRLHGTEATASKSIL